MLIISCNPKWLNVHASIWHSTFRKRTHQEFHPDVAGIVHELVPHFFRITGMRGLLSHPPTPVVHKRKQKIAPHKHAEHVIIYYPLDHPCRLFTLDDEYTPVKNTAVYMPPTVSHSVEENTYKTTRLSLALRWVPE